MSTFVTVVCFVGSGQCEELITDAEGVLACVSNFVCVCDLETYTTRRLKPTLDCSVAHKILVRQFV